MQNTQLICLLIFISQFANFYFTHFNLNYISYKNSVHSDFFNPTTHHVAITVKATALDGETEIACWVRLYSQMV